MSIVNSICKFKSVRMPNFVESGKNVSQRCWYPKCCLSRCREMLREAKDRLAEIKLIAHSNSDIRIACWECTVQVLTDEIAYRERNGID